MTSLLSQVNQLRSYVRELDFEKAKECSDVLYQDGIKMIRKEVKEGLSGYIPLTVASVLVEVLASSEIQMEDRLKFSISRICNLFTLFACGKALLFKRKIQQETQTKMIECCERVLATLPLEAVNTYFNVSCCKQMAKKFETGDSSMKRHGLKAMEVFAGAYEVNPFRIASRGFECINGLAKEIPSGWVNHVYSITFRGVSVKGLKDMGEVYEPYLNHSDRKNRIEMALIGTITQIIQCSKDNEFKRQLVVSTDKKTPGLQYFAKNVNPIAKKLQEIISQKKIEKVMDGNWNVRLCALQAMQHLIAEQAINPELKAFCIKTLAKREAKEVNACILFYLKRAYATFSVEKQNRWDSISLAEVPKQKKKNEKDQKSMEKEKQKVKAGLEKGTSLLEATGSKTIDPKEKEELERQEKNLDTVLFLLRAQQVQLDLRYLELTRKGEQKS